MKMTKKEALLRLEYEEYLKWFEQKKKEVGGIEEIVSKQLCENWVAIHKALPVLNENPVQLTFGQWCWITAKDADLRPHMLRNKARNKAMFAEYQNMVMHMGKWEPINEEYVQRLEETKRLKKALEKYSGNKELASDLLFQAKKEADAQGKDFKDVARQSADKMEGRLIVPDAPINLETLLPKKPYGEVRKTREKYEMSKPVKVNFLHRLLNKLGITR